jgi:uncharacterized membrane protein
LDPLTLSLMLLAGLLHATWHGLVRGGADQMINLAGMGVISAAVGIVVLPFVPAPTSAMWPVYAVSIGLHATYKVSLARAYRAGDLAQAFPLARGAVPLFATAIAFIALNQTSNLEQLIGIGLISIGILSLTFERMRGPIDGWLLLATSVAGLAVASYSVVDAYGTRLYGNWLGFTAWLIVVDSLAFLALSFLLRGAALWSGISGMRWRILASGLLGVASFIVFLWALSRNAVGPVSAVRETSILFALIIGRVIYHEPLSTRRLAGGLLIFVGIVIIAVNR